MIANSKSTRLIAGIAFTFAISLAARHAPAPYRGIAVDVVLAALVGRWLMSLPAACRRIAAASRAGETVSGALLHVLPDRLRNLLHVELAIYREVLCAAARRLRPSQRIAATLPAGARFTLHRGAISSVLLPLLVIASFAELPLLHLVIHSHAPAAMRLPLHAALVGLTVWGLLWMFGDRSAVRHVPHVIAEEELLLNVGLRVAVRIPSFGVHGVRVLEGAPRDWMAELEVDRRDVAFVTPVDKPNVLIELANHQGRATHARFGHAAPVPRYFAIYADKAEGFRNEIVARYLSR